MNDYLMYFPVGDLVLGLGKLA